MRLVDVKFHGAAGQRMDDEQDFDLLVLTLLFGFVADSLQIIESEEKTLLQDHIKEQRRFCRSLPAEKTRPTWTGFCNRVSDSHFRRQFRMTRNCFTNLCNILCTAVGVCFRGPCEALGGNTVENPFVQPYKIPEDRTGLHAPPQFD